MQYMCYKKDEVMNMGKLAFFIKNILLLVTADALFICLFTTYHCKSQILALILN